MHISQWLPLVTLLKTFAAAVGIAVTTVAALLSKRITRRRQAEKLDPDEIMRLIPELLADAERPLPTWQIFIRLPPDRCRLPDLEEALEALETQGRVLRTRIQDSGVECYSLKEVTSEQ